MIIADVLRTKGGEVYTIASSASLADVVESLVDRNCGSLIVVDDDRMVGIITERDILRACASKRGFLEGLSVCDHMSADVVVGSPEDSINRVMQLMTDNRVRHLPIVAENGALAGMISIGDVVKAQTKQLSVENHYLKNYIQG